MTSTLVIVRHGESVWNAKNLFTGWVDVDLSAKGEAEAKNAGALIKKEGLFFDACHTSLLTRAVRTANLALEVAGQLWLPVNRTWRLNERHYGDLQGKDKVQMVQQFGAEQVKLWRRSYDVQPPNGESLKDTAARVLPYWEKEIWPAVLRGENVIVAAHGNSLRSLVMHLDKLTQEQVLELNIPTGVPLLYVFDEKGKEISHKYL